jgi:hypothetical protein
MLAGQGDNAIKRVFALGGSVSELETFEGQLWLSDQKLRRLYQASVADLMTGGAEGDTSVFTSIEGFPFGTQDLLATERGLWVATGGELRLIDPEGFIEGYEVAAERLIEAHPLVVGGEGLTISNIAENGALRIDNFLLNPEADLEEVVGIEGSRVQKLTTFIKYQEP